MNAWIVYIHSATSFRTQEHLAGTDIEREVIQLMLKELEQIFGLKCIEGCVTFSKLQLWGAGVPLNIWESDDAGAECVWDAGIDRAAVRVSYG